MDVSLWIDGYDSIELSNSFFVNMAHIRAHFLRPFSAPSDIKK